MYFEDESEYRYLLPEGCYLHGVKNIGWLDSAYPFVKGDVEPIFLEKLAEIILKEHEGSCYVVNRIRGFYKCEFCEEEIIKINNGEKVGYLGMSEIWIPSHYECEYYAFPSLIFHYISSHKYKPPEKFISSIFGLDVNKPFMAQKIYDSKIKRLNINFWQD